MHMGLHACRHVSACVRMGPGTLDIGHGQKNILKWDNGERKRGTDGQRNVFRCASA